MCVCVCVCGGVYGPGFVMSFIVWNHLDSEEKIRVHHECEGGVEKNPQNENSCAVHNVKYSSQFRQQTIDIIQSCFNLYIICIALLVSLTSWYNLTGYILGTASHSGKVFPISCVFYRFQAQSLFVGTTSSFRFQYCLMSIHTLSSVKVQ